MESAVRRATPADAPEVGRLLHDFNTEFSEPVPEVDVLAKRVAQFIDRDQATFLLAGSGPDGVAEVRLRPSIMTGALDAYLEELYVAPARRGQGLGRALLEAAMRIGPSVSTICDHIHRHDGEAGVRRILGVLSLAKKHGPAVIEDAAKAALDLGVPTYRFLRRYLERRPPVPLTLKQVDPLIRQLTLYRDLIDRTGDTQ